MNKFAKLGALSLTAAVLSACSANGCGCFLAPVPAPVVVEKPRVIQQEPAPAPVVAPQCEFTLSGDVLFDFDKYNLSTQGKAELDRIAGELRNCNQHVTVTGYTDRLGSVAYNLNLSQNRANVVAAYLRTQGVNDVHPIGKGKADQIKACEGYPAPVAGKHSEAEKECLRPNRRVVISAQ